MERGRREEGVKTGIRASVRKATIERRREGLSSEGNGGRETIDGEMERGSVGLEKAGDGGERRRKGIECETH